jgi:Universal stress protein family
VNEMREILVHGGPDEAFNRAVMFARRMAESFSARLHVLYTVSEPLSAGWTAEVSAERLPELHDAIVTEAQERLAALIPLDDQERLGVEFVVRTGPAAEELVRYTTEANVDLAIVQLRGGEDDSGPAHALLEHGRCAVLILR